MDPEAWSDELLSRIEDAGLNATVPPQQRWLDGWLVRYSPGQARRARCINAVAAGRLPLDQKLQLAAGVYAGAGLPMVVRVTRFSQPARLDAALAERGYSRSDDTWVMVLQGLPGASRSKPSPLPDGIRLATLAPLEFAQAVGALRGSTPAQRHAHGERLAHAPVVHQGCALVQAGGTVLACGQFTCEAELVGLYDIITAETARGRGLATLLCEHMLFSSASQGGKVAYLQVEGDNHAARRIYTRLGFVNAYAYHYRQQP